MKLVTGTRILYWDESPNGDPVLRPATVVRARGNGVTLARGDQRFRVARGDVAKIVRECRVCAGHGAVRAGRPAHPAFGSRCDACDGEGWETIPTDQGSKGGLPDVCSSVDRGDDRSPDPRT